MKNIKVISWIAWLILVIFWNYGYPEASPFLDVLVAVILAFLNFTLTKIFKK
tara:strand:- start:2159 stop:2314 length:156 start_codon:yes stop_codon:yes gene_type:complete